MQLASRRWLLRALPALAGLPVGVGVGVSALAQQAVQRGRQLVFPFDHGAHEAQRIEWWYVTGWLGASANEPQHGFQITFFRVRTGLGDGMKSRFAPRQLLMAHAAVTDLKAAKHRHAERLVRAVVEDIGPVKPGSAADTAAPLRNVAARGDALLRIGSWHLSRSDDAGAAGRLPLGGQPSGPQASLWQASVDAADWSLALLMRGTQPLLLQGDKGFSRKGPLPTQASHYVTEPQLSVRARLTHQGRAADLQGCAWLDHEWSDTLMPADALGWDWIGMNLDDGSALTAFRLRRADGSAAWAGGSFRDAAGALRVFDANELQLTPGRTWRSPATQGVYPVQWTVICPVGRFEVRSLLDAQELDARLSTGTVYWEGLSSLHGAQGERVGWGYLEMTGYAGRLTL